MQIRQFRDLEVYTLAKENALAIYNSSKSFPVDERYSLTDQIRRSSRSVCTNIAEAWHRRRYKAAFIAKLSDSLSECAETQVWLEFALAHGYINNEQYQELNDSCEHVIAMLTKMTCNVDLWLIKVRS